MPSYTPEQYEKVREILGITPGEPIFVLRAQDQVALTTLEDYAFNVHHAKATVEFANSVYNETMENDEQGDNVWGQFDRWRRDNEDKVKLPD